MGNSIHNVSFGNTGYDVLVAGVENSGKTSFVYRFTPESAVTGIIDSYGLDSRPLKYSMTIHEVTLNFQDSGNKCSFDRVFDWKYFSPKDAILFMIDSKDIHMMEQSKRILECLVHEQTFRNIPILILANKQDLPGSLNPDEISKSMQLYETLEGRRYLTPIGVWVCIWFVETFTPTILKIQSIIISLLS